MWCHGVRGHYPAALPQLVGDGEFVKMVVVLGVEAESDKRETVTAALAMDK